MRVFVYGTLKQGYGNNGLLTRQNATFVGNALTHAEYQIVDLGGIPGMILGDHIVSGELWDVEDIEPLDWLEGHPTFYRRSLVRIASVGGVGNHQVVQGYIFQGEGRDWPVDDGNVQEWNR